MQDLLVDDSLKKKVKIAPKNFDDLMQDTDEEEKT